MRPAAALLLGSAWLAAACDPSLPPPDIAVDPATCLPPWAASALLGVTSNGARRPCAVTARREGCRLALTIDGCEPDQRPTLTLDFDPSRGARPDAPIAARNGSTCAPLPKGRDDLRLACGDTRYALADRGRASGLRVLDARVLVEGATLLLPFNPPEAPTTALNSSSIALSGGWLGGSAALEDRVWVAVRDQFLVRCERDVGSQLVALDAETLETRGALTLPGCLSRVAAMTRPAAIFVGIVRGGRHFIGRVDPARGTLTATIALPEPFDHERNWDMFDLATSDDGDLYVAMGSTLQAQADRRSAYLWFDADLRRRGLVMPGESEEPRAIVGRGSRLRATRRGSIALVDVDFASGRYDRAEIGFALEPGRLALVERPGVDLFVALAQGGVTYPGLDGVAWSFTPTVLAGGMTVSSSVAYVGFSGPFMSGAPTDLALPARVARVTLDPLHVDAAELPIGEGFVGELHRVAPNRLVATLPWSGAVVTIETPRD